MERLPLLGQEGRWHRELPEPYGIDFLAPLPALPSHLHSPWPSPPLVRAPDQVRALYVNAWAFGGSRFRELIRLADESEVNALVMDVKDDTGFLTYPSKVPTALSIGATKELRARDAAARVREMLAHGIYPIARIVVAKDPLLAERKPGWAIQSSAGGLWRDRRGTAWVDAFNDSVWVYAAQVAAEAIEMGFAEVQFDYVRFPTDGRLSAARYSRPDTQAVRLETVAAFLAESGRQLGPTGVFIAADVFGYTAFNEHDTDIGQRIEELAPHLDYLCPMVYPSGYHRGIPRVRNPVEKPYDIVRESVRLLDS